MRRREFITFLGGAATWSLAARAQQPTMPVIGFLNAQRAAGFQHLVAAFQRGLNEVGFVEGQNVAIEYRWADGHIDRLPALADELIRRRVAVIVATGGAIAQVATASIPIVATFGGDPVRLGHVAGLNQPGGNITGMIVLSFDLEAKRLELLHELVPTGSIGVLLDRAFDWADLQQRVVETAAATIGRGIRIAEASTDADLEKAFAILADAHVAGVIVTGAPLFYNLRDHVLALTARLALPVIYEQREFTVAGGLMSYGTNVPNVYRQIGRYTGRVLKGEKPADLPVLQPVKFDVAINLKTAKAEADTRDAQDAARILGMQLQVLSARTEGDINKAFETLVQRNAGGLLIEGDPFFGVSRLKQLVVLTARHGLPAIYQGREFPDAGGLMSYGASRTDALRVAGVYTGRILTGEKPADLPVQQSTKVELIINLGTAKALGIEVPPLLLARADEVIE